MIQKRIPSSSSFSRSVRIMSLFLLLLLLVLPSRTQVQATPTCTVSPFLLNNYEDIYGCGIDRCSCPMNGLVYSCEPTAGESGVCDFQGGGFPFIAAAVCLAAFIFFFLHRCIGFCTSSRDKSKQILRRMTLENQNVITVTSVTPTKSQTHSVTIPMKPLPNPNWEHVGTGILDGNLKASIDSKWAEKLPISSRRIGSERIRSKTRAGRKFDTLSEQLQINGGNDSPLYSPQFIGENFGWTAQNCASPNEKSGPYHVEEFIEKSEEITDGTTYDWLSLIDENAIKDAPDGLYSGRSQAVIKLETLNDWRLKLLVVAVFCSFIIAVVLVMSPLAVVYTDHTTPPSTCTDESSVDCYISSGNSSFSPWIGAVSGVEFDTIFFGVLLNETTFPAERLLTEQHSSTNVSLPRLTFTLPYDVSLVDSSSDGIKVPNKETKQSFEREITCDCTNFPNCDFYRCQRTYLLSIRTRSAGEQPLRSEVNSLRFYINVTTSDTPFLSAPVLQYQKGSAINIGYKTILILLLVSSFSNMIFYASRLRRVKMKYWTKEQFLMLQLSIATFLYVNVVFCFLLWTSSASTVLVAISGILEAIATVWIYAIILLLIDGSRFDSFPSVVEKPTFYCYKALFLLVLGVTICTMTFFISGRTIEEAAKGIGYESLRYLAIVRLSLTLYFLIYASAIFAIASIKMATIDQVQTRYRQLAFRQYFYQFLYLSILTLLVTARSFGNIVVENYVTQFPIINQQLMTRAAEGIAYVSNTLVLCYTFLPVHGKKLRTKVLCRYTEPAEITEQMLSECINRDNRRNRQGGVTTDSTPTGGPYGTADSVMSSIIRSLLRRQTAAPRLENKQIETNRAFCVQTAVLMYNLSSLVYIEDSDDPAMLDAVHALGFKIIGEYEDKETENRVMLFRGRDRIVVAFRGTISREQLLRVDMDTKFVTAVNYESKTQSYPFQQVLDPLTSAKSNPQFHRGFYHSYMQLSSYVLSVIGTSLREDGDVKVYTTGHSLGGALAMICAFHLTACADDNPLSFIYNKSDTQGSLLEQTDGAVDPVYNLNRNASNTIMYSFGQPRVGDYTFSRLFNKSVPSAFRMIVDGDFIVGTPHYPSVVPCGVGVKRYHHAGKPVVLDASGTGAFIIEPSFVEKMILLRSHRKVYSHLLSTYGHALRGVIHHCVHVKPNESQYNFLEESSSSESEGSEEDQASGERFPIDPC